LAFPSDSWAFVAYTDRLLRLAASSRWTCSWAGWVNLPTRAGWLWAGRHGQTAWNSADQCCYWSLTLRSDAGKTHPFLSRPCLPYQRHHQLPYTHRCIVTFHSISENQTSNKAIWRYAKSRRFYSPDDSSNFQKDSTTKSLRYGPHVTQRVIGLTIVPAKWHINLSNGLSRAHKYDRRLTNGEKDKPRYEATCKKGEIDCAARRDSVCKSSTPTHI